MAVFTPSYSSVCYTIHLLQNIYYITILRLHFWLIPNQKRVARQSEALRGRNPSFWKIEWVCYRFSLVSIYIDLWGEDASAIIATSIPIPLFSRTRVLRLEMDYVSPLKRFGPTANPIWTRKWLEISV